jgi:hypothetical protein
MPVKRTVNQGHDRLTRIADRALQFIEADPDMAEGDRVIVMLNNGRDTGGMGLLGYVGRGAEDLAASDLGGHVRALLKTGQPQLATPKGALPAGLQRPGGPGWLSRKDPK